MGLEETWLDLEEIPENKLLVEGEVVKWEMILVVVLTTHKGVLICCWEVISARLF